MPKRKNDTPSLFTSYSYYGAKGYQAKRPTEGQQTTLSLDKPKRSVPEHLSDFVGKPTRLFYLPTQRSRKWRKSFYVKAFSKVAYKEALALQKQSNWAKIEFRLEQVLRVKHWVTFYDSLVGQTCTGKTIQVVTGEQVHLYTEGPKTRHIYQTECAGTFYYGWLDEADLEEDSYT